jgi:tetratricopeptide (TPR) repeat protein/nucleoside phosphorylase
MTQDAPMSPTCQVIILTALPVEFQAVVAYLQETQEIIHPQGTIYRVGSFVGNYGPLRVAVAQIGMGGGSAAVETERAIHFFRPHLLLFVGIAGGLKDVQLGDVVAATKVYAYESGKAGQTFELRPEVWRASYPLEQRARHEVSEEAWHARLKRTPPDTIPRAHIGALAAGEKVLASTQSIVYRQLKATYGDALAIEMEGHGFLQAVHVNHDMHGLVIRGISDLIDGKATADANGSQSRAAHHAAAFAFQVLATFTIPPAGDNQLPLTQQAIWTVPYPRNPYFTGRDDLLDRLAQQLSPGSPEYGKTTCRVALTQPQAIKGLGGIGKTQIAIEYAYRARGQGHYIYTFWINAASEETLYTDFVALAELLPAFPAQGEPDQRKLVSAIKRWLEQCQERWLLIFDNVDDIAMVREYFPQDGNGNILLTTRANAVGSLAASIEVETMGFLEGTQLLLRRAQRFEHASDEEINQVGNIVVALDHFPLALDQAGAYIEETQCSFQDYLDLYQTHRRALLARRGLISTDYPYSVATTWSLSFQKVQQACPAAAELLHLCAFLAPDRIPEELLKDGAAHWPPLLQRAVSDPFSFQQMIAELLKFSLVKRLVEDHSLSIHRLVQAVQRDQMESEMQYQWAQRMIRAVDAVFPGNPQDLASWPQCLRFLDQVQACSALTENYLLSIIEAADLLNRAGLYVVNHALYSIAEQLYQRALTLREQLLGADHLNTATSLNNLAGLYYEQGRYAQAEPLYVRALSIYKQHVGTEHPLIAGSLNNLASLYRTQGKYAQAEPLYQQALVIDEQIYEPDHPEIAKDLDNLAGLFYEQGKYVQAEPLYQRALTINEQRLGADHLNTATSLNNLALLYYEQGKYAQAEPLYVRALSIYKQHLGADHPTTAIGLNNLAGIYRVQGEYAQAESLYQQALVIDEQSYGSSHPTVATDLNNLAVLYENQRKYLQAESLCQRALSIRETQLGADHPDTASSLNNLALLYKLQGKYSQAEPLYQRAFSIYTQLLGADHPAMTNILNNLAGLYYTMGKYSQAESLYQRALLLCEQHLGADHPDTASSLNNLASVYVAQEKYTQAELFYQRALASKEAHLGPTHPSTRNTRRNYASLLLTLGRETEAKTFSQTEEQSGDG